MKYRKQAARRDTGAATYQKLRNYFKSIADYLKAGLIRPAVRVSIARGGDE
jgi:hypothetical protein